MFETVVDIVYLQISRIQPMRCPEHCHGVTVSEWVGLVKVTKLLSIKVRSLVFARIVSWRSDRLKWKKRFEYCTSIFIYKYNVDKTV